MHLVIITQLSENGGIQSQSDYSTNLFILLIIDLDGGIEVLVNLP